MIQTAIDKWSAWPTWARWASGIGALVLIEAVMVASQERDFFAGLVEHSFALVLRYGVLAAAFGDVGIALGLRVCLRGGGLALGLCCLACFSCFCLTLLGSRGALGGRLLALFGLALCCSGLRLQFSGAGSRSWRLLRRRAGIASCPFLLWLRIPDFGNKATVLRGGLPLQSQRQQADQRAMHQQRTQQRQAAPWRGRRHQLRMRHLQAVHVPDQRAATGCTASAMRCTPACFSWL